MCGGGNGGWRRPDSGRRLLRRCFFVRPCVEIYFWKDTRELGLYDKENTDNKQEKEYFQKHDDVPFFLSRFGRYGRGLRRQRDGMGDREDRFRFGPRFLGRGRPVVDCRRSCLSQGLGLFKGFVDDAHAKTTSSMERWTIFSSMAPASAMNPAKSARSQRMLIMRGVP